MYAKTIQRCRCCANIPKNTSTIVYAKTMQRCRCCDIIFMNTSITMNAFTTQLGTSCSFDSPGLARNEPTLGKRSQGDSTPSVLSFFYEGMVTMKYFMTG